jgi:hypothetical protein
MGVRAFRFRREEDPQFTIDILRNGRLYCADWKLLNDPMEGTYDTLVTDPDPQKHKAAVIAIYEQKVRLRVCSLSRSYKSHAMWAYYASEYRGAAIEIEFPAGTLKPIDYASGMRIQSWVQHSDPYRLACEILTTKHRDWEREKELRLLSPTEFYQLPAGSIKRVILGSRISKAFERDIRDAAEHVPVQRLAVRSGALKAE